MRTVFMCRKERSRGTARRGSLQYFGTAQYLARAVSLGTVLMACSVVDAAECLPNNPVSWRPPPSFRTDMILYSPIPKDQEAVFFDKGLASLSDVAERTLNLQAAILRANPSERTTVHGHATSDDGETRDDVVRLSRARATAVRDRLVELGVPAERLSIEAHGAEAVIVLKDTEEVRRKLRRVEVLIAPRFAP